MLDADSSAAENTIAFNLLNLTGSDPKRLPISYEDLRPGVLIKYVDPPVGGLGGTVDLQAMQALEKSIEPTKLAAKTLCNDLRLMGLTDVSVDPDFGTEETWRNVPKNGLIIRVGPRKNSFMDRKLNTARGQQWVNDLEDSSNALENRLEENAHRQYGFTPPTSCDPW